MTCLLIFDMLYMWCREQSESGSSIKLLSLPRIKGAAKEGMLRACGEWVWPCLCTAMLKSLVWVFVLVYFFRHLFLLTCCFHFRLRGPVIVCLRPSPSYASCKRCFASRFPLFCSQFSLFVPQVRVDSSSNTPPFVAVVGKKTVTWEDSINSLYSHMHALTPLFPLQLQAAGLLANAFGLYSICCSWASRVDFLRQVCKQNGFVVKQFPTLFTNTTLRF